MKKYVKKPIPVSAIQWHPGLKIEGAEIREMYNAAGEFTNAWIDTLQGSCELNDNDWVIHNELQSEFYPCNPDYFSEMYQEFEEIAE